MLRIPGLATGMDTDNMVKQLMKAEYMKVDKVKQQRQTLVWQQEAYRGVLEDFNMFKSTYFDVLKSDTYMLSNRNYASYQVSGAAEANGVKVTPGANAVGGSYTMNVTNAAEKATLKGDKAINVQTLNSSVYGVKIDDNNNVVTINGKQITLDNGKYNNLSDVASAINSKIQGDTDLKDTVKAVVKDNKISFYNLIDINDTNKEITFSYDGNSYKVTVGVGKYTAEELAAAVNLQVKDKVSENDSNIKFPSGYTVIAKEDGSGFQVKDNNSTPKITDIALNNGQDILPNSTTLVSTATSSDDHSNITIASNTLSFDNKIIAGFNDKFNVKIGTADSVMVTLAPGTVADVDGLVAKVNSALDTAGINTIDTTKLIAQKSSDGKVQLVSTSGEQVIITGDPNASANSVLGINSSYYELNMATSQKMSDIINTPVNFTINGVDFSYDFSGTGTDKSKTISDILADISSKANVDITYSQLTKKFTMTSKSEGSSQTITTSDTSGGFLSAIFGTATATSGKDATVTIKGPNGSSTITKPTNNFTIDGVNYQLSSNTPIGTDITFNLSKDPSKTFENIKSLVDKYNEIIGKINSKLTEKKQYKYQPLTDEQRKDMKDDDIKLWEERAKMGIIKGDSQLQGMLIKLRQAFSDKVEGAGISLSDIGITTSRDYKEGGKLVIDEEKLKKAISENGDKVASLFTKETSSNYKYYNPDLTASQRKERYEDEGIFQRVNDILQDYTRITRDSKGRKGSLLEKAGIKGDFSDLNSTLSKYITEKDDLIDRLNEKLADKENKYYLQFAQLERAMSQMNQQSAWLAQQFGGGGQ